VLGVAACQHGGKTPEEAYQRLLTAVEARNGGLLYDALDLGTRWSWMSVQRAHREAYDIVLSNYPPGAERDRSLHRFQAGAQAESPRQLFAGDVGADPQVWSELTQDLAAIGSSPRLAVDGPLAVASRDGRTLVFRKGTDRHWGWGYAGLADKAEQTKRRAMADLDLVRTSATDYERAAARASR
jgi:hypothetical protein